MVQKTSRILAVAIGLMGAAATPALAQEAGPTQVISVNPIGLLFEVLSAEYERTFSPSSTLGAAVTLFSPDEFTYFSAEGKYRYYPQGRPLQGFSFGGGAGFTLVSSDYEDTCAECEDESATALSISIGLDYQWLLGANERFAVAAGIGGKRLFFLGDELEGAAAGYPTARVSVGYAF